MCGSSDKIVYLQSSIKWQAHSQWPAVCGRLTSPLASCNFTTLPTLSSKFLIDFYKPAYEIENNKH